MTKTPDEDIVREGKFFAIISYVSFLCIITLILKKDNKFALYHARQGLVLFVMEVAAFILSIIPLLGWLIGIFGYALFLLVSIWINITSCLLIWSTYYCTIISVIINIDRL